MKFSSWRWPARRSPVSVDAFVVVAAAHAVRHGVSTTQIFRIVEVVGVFGRLHAHADSRRPKFALAGRAEDAQERDAARLEFGGPAGLDEAERAADGLRRGRTPVAWAAFSAAVTVLSSSPRC